MSANVTKCQRWTYSKHLQHKLASNLMYDQHGGSCQCILRTNKKFFRLFLWITLYPRGGGWGDGLVGDYTPI